MNDLTPEELRKQLQAGIPEAPDVSEWPSQIGDRIAARQRRTIAVQVIAAVAVLALAAGLMWRAASTTTPGEPTQIAVGGPATSITPTQASQSTAAGKASTSPSVAPASGSSSQGPAPTTASPTALPVTDAPSASTTEPSGPADVDRPCGGKQPAGDNPRTLAAGALILWWCTPTDNSLAAPLEALEAAAADQVAARYNALPSAPAQQCSPDPGATYWLVFVYPDGTQITLSGDFSHCNRVGAKNDSRALTTTLGKAFDRQRARGYPEVDVAGSCGTRGYPMSDSFMAFKTTLLTVGFRCQKGRAIPLPRELVGAMASGLETVPSDLVFDPQGAWLVAYTASGDPLHLWIVDGWVWAERVVVSGDPRATEYVGWEPSAEQLAVLLGR